MTAALCAAAATVAVACCLAVLADDAGYQQWRERW